MCSLWACNFRLFKITLGVILALGLHGPCCFLSVAPCFLSFSSLSFVPSFFFSLLLTVTLSLFYPSSIKLPLPDSRGVLPLLTTTFLKDGEELPPLRSSMEKLQLRSPQPWSTAAPALPKFLA